MLDGHLKVVTVHLKVLDFGVHVLHLDIVRIQRGTGFVGFFARLGVTALAVLDAHFAGLDFPWLVVAIGLGSILGHGMVLAVLLGILLAGMLIVHVGLFHVQAAHIHRLFSCIDFHILSLGMAYLGIEVIYRRLHIHLEVHIVGSDLVGIDLPRLARFLVRFRFLFLGFIAHFGLAALECGIAHIHLVVVQVNRSLIDIGIVQIHVKVHRAVFGLDLAFGALERGIIHFHLLVQQGARFHVALDLIGLEQGIAVLVDDLNIGSADVKREFHPHVTHADVHARLLAGIFGSGIGHLVLDPRDIQGKRQCRHHAQNAAAYPSSELREHISLFAKHLCTHQCTIRHFN